MNFKTSKFKDIIEYKSGYTWSKEQETKLLEKNTVRVLTVTNVQEKLDLSSKLYLKNVTEKDKCEKAVSQDWCIAVSSNGNRKRIGNAVFISNNTDYLFASFLTAFKPKENADILPKYFYYLLSSHEIQGRITSVSEGTTGLGNLDIRYLRNMELSFPDNLSEQHAFASILSKLDDAIEATENSIKGAEKLKKSLMQNLLTGKLKPDGTWRIEEEFYFDKKFGKVPMGWEIKKGWQIADKITKGQSPKWQGFEYQDSGTLFVTSENVRDGWMDIISPKFLPLEFNEKLKGSQLKEGDILINIVGASIGRSCIFNTNHNTANINQAVCLFRPKKDYYNQYLSYYLQLPRTVFWLMSNQSETARANLSLGDMRRLKFVFPSNYGEQRTIADKIDSLNNVLFSKFEKIQTLKTLKKSLMQNLLTGKVRVDVEKINALLGEA